MASAAPSPAIAGVLGALDALYKNPERAAKEQANAWLQTFQSQPEAWETANSLLLAQDLPVEPRLFAAQTFRTKTTFDLEQVPPASRLALRSTLLTALAAYLEGPRVIRTQLCLTLAALALQLEPGSDPEWGDRVVPAMIERFGNDPSSVALLLEFLTALPEEITTNHRIPIDNDRYKERASSLLSAHADEVLRILAMYIQAQGITSQIQSAVFECLRSWLRAGEIQTSTLIATPLFQLSFEALQSDELFDVAIDVLCDVINETQEVHDNMGAIELIVPRLLPLRADLAKAIEDGDDDKVRGLCRLFVAAGETYHQLILRHREQFFPIVEAIASCAAYAEIEIVQITFRFWWMLASGLGKARADPSIQPFLDVFERILSIVIRLLRWSDDVDTASASDVADQRELRHNLGDTLKDCCQVLGARECLTRSLQMIEELLAQASAAGASGAGPKWQDIEAPLFSMRAMGRVADMQDNDVTPRIMDIVSALPEHPKVKYAGLLVVCRYTEWVAAHPERIPPVLSYISSGLQGAHIEDTGAAAAQALNYLCQDCAHLLLPYLPQLYDFFHSVSGEALPNSDLMQVTEAIALVVAGIQGADERTSTALHFLQPLLQALQAFAASTESSSEAIGKATSKMEQLQVFLHALGRGRNLEEEPLPEACAKTCVDVYALLDRIIETRGSSVVVAERTCHLLRRGMAFFGDAARPVVPAMLSRLSDAFATSGHSCYIWIVGKCIDAYGPHADAQLQAAMLAAFERVSAKTLEQLEVTPAAEMSDTIDDYVNACAHVTARSTALIVLSPVFPHALRVAMTALTLLDQRVVEGALEFLNEVLSSESLSLPVLEGQRGVALEPYGGVRSTPPSEEAARCAAIIRQVVPEQVMQLVALLLQGLTGAFSPDVMYPAMAAMRHLAVAFPSETAAGVAATAAHLPTSSVSLQERERFVESFTTAVANQQPVRPALQALYGASRKARERARVDRDAGLFDVDRS